MRVYSGRLGIWRLCLWQQEQQMCLLRKYEPGGLSVCGVCVAHVGGVHVCTCMWQSEDNLGCHSSSLSTLLLFKFFSRQSLSGA